MNWPEDQIAELKLISTDLSVAEEGGYTFILMKDVILPDGCTPEKSDVLLCPLPRDGYTSRLFFAKKIEKNPAPNPAINWTPEQRILDQTWYVYSWKTNHDNLRLAQMVKSHLQQLR